MKLPKKIIWHNSKIRWLRLFVQRLWTEIRDCSLDLWALVDRDSTRAHSRKIAERAEEMLEAREEEIDAYVAGSQGAGLYNTDFSWGGAVGPRGTIPDHCEGGPE